MHFIFASVTCTHFTGIVARVGALAALSVELKGVSPVQLQDLSAVQAELVRGKGDAVVALGFSCLRKVGQFLTNHSSL